MPITRPVNIPKPFANIGGKNTIPSASQIGIVPGAASLDDGFPPLTRTPVVAGGVPPSGLDMNGILFMLSSHVAFMNGGGRYRFDATLATAIGGYPVGFVLQSDDGNSEYVNILAANSTNFNTTPASIGVSWIPYAGQALLTTKTPLADTGAANAYTAVNVPPLSALPATSGLIQTVSIANLNTGASTYAPDGLAPKPIYGLKLAPLTGGELPVKGIAQLLYVVATTVNSGNGAWVILSCTGGNLQIPDATGASHALALGQADLRYMAITGGLNFNGIASAAITTIWAKAASVGKFIYITAAGATTQTLPLASTFSSGQAIMFFNNGTGTPTFARQGTDGMLGVMGGGTSFVLNPTEAVILTTDGVSWFCNFFNGGTGLPPRSVQDMTASRAILTNVTNNSGRSIFVSVSARLAQGSSYLQMIVSGIAYIGSETQSVANQYSAVTVEVPNLATYQLQAFTETGTATTISALSWKETR